MTIKLIRCCTSPQGTFGTLVMDDLPVCNTVERQWLGNAPHISCIPAGTYELRPYLSPTKGAVWLFDNVPDRDMIELHIANTYLELLGCVAPGQGFGDFHGVRGVAHSADAMKELKQKLPQNFQLEIISAF